MLPFLWKDNPDRLEIGALFIQPTRWCGSLSCKGCYVKEHYSSGIQISLSELFYLFNIFYNSTIAWANQITISVDNLPKDTKPKAFMIGFWRVVMRTLKSDKRLPEQRPAVHMTCHSEITWQQYVETTWENLYSNENEAAQFPDVLSLSNIKNLDNVKNLAQHTHVNYNHLIPTSISSANIDTYVERMIEIGRVVQSIYLIVNKSPVGVIRSERVVESDKQRMTSDLSIIKTLLERLPSDVQNKVNIDGCIEDVDKARKTGFGCSSNVSRFQVWPDGSVSGCPYAFKGIASHTIRAEDILANIRKARKTYDFRERCHLPAIIDSIAK